MTRRPVDATPPWPVGMELQFYVGGVEVVPKGSMRAFLPKGWSRPVITDSGGKELRAYENAIRNAARAELDRRALPCAIRQPFEVHMCFYLARPDADFDKHRNVKPGARATPWVKPDLDKMQRGALDALTKLVWDDDSRVVRLVVEKRFSDATRDVGTWIRVRALAATLRELLDSQQPRLQPSQETRTT